MTRKMFRKSIYILLFGTAVIAGCDILNVEDPQRFTDEDLDTKEAVEAVGDGVLGDLYVAQDDFVNVTALLADEYIHTGTWTDWQEVTDGQVRAGRPNAADGTFNDLAQARWSAQDAQDRIKRVLGEEGENSLNMVKAKTVEGFANLYLGMAYCEAPVESGGEAVPDQRLFERAIEVLGETRSIAENIENDEWANLTTAGIARAHLLAGNYSEAGAEAEKIPKGFSHEAVFSSNTGRQENEIVQLTRRGFNQAGGVHPRWWDQVDTDEELLQDPWSDKLDPRVSIGHNEGELGVDGSTRHFTQLKYNELSANIPIAGWKEMRLVEAEVHWRDGELSQAIDLMNSLRKEAGLPSLDDTNDEAQVREYLLYERFAELFLEGHRLTDLSRFGLVEEILGKERNIKFPVSTDEINSNPNISTPRGCPDISG